MKESKLTFLLSCAAFLFTVATLVLLFGDWGLPRWVTLASIFWTFLLFSLVGMASDREEDDEKWWEDRANWLRPKPGAKNPEPVPTLENLDLGHLDF